jgi:hypothetical protein
MLFGDHRPRFFQTGIFGTGIPCRIVVATKHSKVKVIFFFLSFTVSIGWQLSNCNCCKPFCSLLYNCQLLCFWRLALSRGLPTAFLSEYCSFKDVYYKVILVSCKPWRLQTQKFRSPTDKKLIWHRKHVLTLKFKKICCFFFFICATFFCQHLTWVTDVNPAGTGKFETQYLAILQRHFFVLLTYCL